MMFSSFVLLGGIALFSSAAAQNTWPVTVGDATGDTIFTPNVVNALPGDTVQFTFNPKNHSVTQSTFASPCTPSPNGFDAGFNPVAVGTTSDFPIFTITLEATDTAPIWVYCRQGENTPASHCGKGMVFAINPGANGTSNSFANFQAAAEAVGAALSSSASLSATSATPPSTSTVTSSEISPSATSSETSPSETKSEASPPETKSEASPPETKSESSPSSTAPASTASSKSNRATSLIVEGSFVSSAIGAVLFWLM